MRKKIKYSIIIKDAIEKKIIGQFDDYGYSQQGVKQKNYPKIRKMALGKIFSVEVIKYINQNNDQLKIL